MFDTLNYAGTLSTFEDVPEAAVDSAKWSTEYVHLPIYCIVYFQFFLC